MGRERNKTLTHEISRRNVIDLVIDIGTHAVRAALVDSSNQAGPEILHLFSLDIALLHHSNTHIEQDAQDILMKTQKVIRQALSVPGVTVNKAALAIQRSTVLAWNDAGEALGPALSWQDTRAKSMLEEPSIQAMAKKITAISGLPLSPHYGASKLKYLRTQHSHVNKSHKLRLSPLVSYILFHILQSSNYICDESNAGRTQLYDIVKRCWSVKLCTLFGIEKKELPDVVPIRHSYGILKESDVELTVVCGDQNSAYQYMHWLCDRIAFPQRPSNKIFSCFHDFKSERVKSENVRNKGLECEGVNTNSVLVNMGSGAFIFLGNDHNTTLKKQVNLTSRFIESLVFSDDSTASYVSEGAVNGVGVALSWISERWLCLNKGAQEDDFFSHIKSNYTQVDQSLLFINVMGGLGSPFWVSGQSSEFLHINESMLSMSTGFQKESLTQYQVLSAEDIDRQLDDCIFAVIESIVFLVAINIELMMAKKAGDATEYYVLSRSFYDVDLFGGNYKLLLSGGVSRVDCICQSLSNVLGVPVNRVEEHDSTVLGLACLLSKNLHISPQITNELVETFHPSCTSKNEEFTDQKIKSTNTIHKRYKVFKHILMSRFSECWSER